MKTFRQHQINEAFTKQHYQKIAKVIHDEAATHYGDPGVEDALGRVANALAEMFKDDNPRFDKGYFLTACGV